MYSYICDRFNGILLNTLGVLALSCQFMPISENVNTRYKGHHRQLDEIKKSLTLVYIYRCFFIYKQFKKNNMKTKPTYILVVISSNYVYTTFYKTIHYKYEINKNDFEGLIINEAKSIAFDLFSNPMHSDCEVMKITTSQNINDEIVFSLLEYIDGEYYTTNNIENKLNDIIEDNKTRKK